MKLVVYLLVGALVVGGGYYYGRDVINFDSTRFPLPKDQVIAMLTDAKTTLPRRDGPGEIKIWSNGRTSNSVTLNMKYASWAPLIACDAMVTAISPKETRVVADCGKSTGDSSALSRTQDGLRAPMFEEHIASTLRKRPFDRSNVDAREAAAVFKNLPAMQVEALEAHAEDMRQRANTERRR